jgi:hypothetical protein
MDAVGDAFDVTEHHGGRGVHAQLVGHPHRGQPRLGVALAEADLPAHGVGEDFPAPAGHRIETRLLQPADHPAQLPGQVVAGGVEEADELDELRRAEGVDVHRGESRLDDLQQVEVPRQREVRVHPALHEDLRPADGHQLLDLAAELVGLQRVGVGLVTIASKGTEGAAGGAHVGVVDVAVDDVGADARTVQGPGPRVRPPAQLLDGQLVVEAEGLFGGHPQLTARDCRQHRGVENVQVVTAEREHRSTLGPPPEAHDRRPGILVEWPGRARWALFPGRGLIGRPRGSRR